jgi:hypothetical protein
MNRVLIFRIRYVLKDSTPCCFYNDAATIENARQKFADLYSYIRPTSIEEVDRRLFGASVHPVALKRYTKQQARIKRDRSTYGEGIKKDRYDEPITLVEDLNNRRPESIEPGGPKVVRTRGRDGHDTVPLLGNEYRVLHDPFGVAHKQDSIHDSRGVDSFQAKYSRKLQFDDRELKVGKNLPRYDRLKDKSERPPADPCYEMSCGSPWLALRGLELRYEDVKDSLQRTGRIQVGDSYVVRKGRRLAVDARSVFQFQPCQFYPRVGRLRGHKPLDPRLLPAPIFRNVHDIVIPGFIRESDSLLPPEKRRRLIEWGMPAGTAKFERLNRIIVYTEKALMSLDDQEWIKTIRGVLRTPAFKDEIDWLQQQGLREGSIPAPPRLQRPIFFERFKNWATSVDLTKMKLLKNEWHKFNTATGYLRYYLIAPIDPRSKEDEKLKDEFWKKHGRNKALSKLPEDFKNPDYVSVLAANADPNPDHMGEDRMRGEENGYHIDFGYEGNTEPQTTDGTYDLTRREVENNHAAWRISKLDSAVGTDLKTSRRYFVFTEIQFCGREKDSAAKELGISVERLSDIFEEWRTKHIAMRTNKIFAFKKAPKEVLNDIIERGGYYAVLPTEPDLSAFEMHKLGDPGHLGLAAGLRGDENASPDSERQRELEELRARLLNQDFEGIESQARMQRSKKACDNAKDNRARFRDWQFTHVEVLYFGRPGELKLRLLEMIREEQEASIAA